MIVQMFARVFQAEDMHFVHVLYVQECANIFCAKYLLSKHVLVQWCGWCSMLSVCILCMYGKPLIEKWSVQGGSGGGVNACLDGLGHFCPCSNRHFLGFGGIRTLARMVWATKFKWELALVFSVLECLFDRGEGGEREGQKLFGMGAF